MNYRHFSLFSAALLLVLPLSEVNAFGQARAMLTRHVREITRTGEAQPIGQLPANQIMNLDLVLPIRDQAGLVQFLKELYDPDSPSYRQFLTVSRFTERFGPSQEDYYALVRFAKQNGFTVVGGTRDGMEVRVTGPVSVVETAFHISMRTYPHPTENRNFYAPDRVRSVTPAISAASIQLIFFAIAFKSTSCNIIVRSTPAALIDPQIVNFQDRRGR